MAYRLAKPQADSLDLSASGSIWFCVWVGLVRTYYCHATCHHRSYQIALQQGNQNPQNNMIASFSFASTRGKCNSKVESFTATGRYFDSTIKFNASTGEEYCEWLVCGTEVAFDIKKVGFTISSLFFPTPASCSEQFSPNESIFP